MDYLKDDYLTEEKLGLFLKELFNLDFERGKRICKIPGVVMDGCNKNLSVDYYNDEIRLAVEFNGYQHFTNARQIDNDTLKELLLEDAGIKMISIPYFIQLSTEMIKAYFGIDYAYIQKYPHGFIDKKAILPADYCSMGVRRFERELFEFLPESITSEIFYSLHEKFYHGQNYQILVPNTLWYLYESAED